MNCLLVVGSCSQRLYQNLGELLKILCKNAARILPFALPNFWLTRLVHELLTAVWHDEGTFYNNPYGGPDANQTLIANAPDARLPASLFAGASGPHNNFAVVGNGR